MIRGMEERLGELELLILEKNRHQGDLTVAFQCLKGAYKKDGVKLFTRACSGKTKCNALK